MTICGTTEAPLFSVVTVTRDNIAGLRRTQESLARQTLRDFEWVVIDGASADGSADFAARHGALVTSEPDGGIYDAMNKGIAAARGCYLLFLNAGDVMAGETVFAALADLIGSLRAEPDFLYGDALEERPGEAPVYKAARPFSRADYGMFTHHQAMLYRRDALGGLRYDTRYGIAADYKFTLLFLMRTGVPVYFPAPLCLFECGGVSQVRTAQGRREQFAIRRELKRVGILRNLAIAGTQAAALTLRRLCPGLYWRLRQSSRNSGRG